MGVSYYTVPVLIITSYSLKVVTDQHGSGELVVVYGACR